MFVRHIPPPGCRSHTNFTRYSPGSIPLNATSPFFGSVLFGPRPRLRDKENGIVWSLSFHFPTGTRAGIKYAQILPALLSKILIGNSIDPRIMPRYFDGSSGTII